MILWFRNDLRTHDNPALQYYMNSHCSGHPRKAFFSSQKNNGTVTTGLRLKLILLNDMHWH